MATTTELKTDNPSFVLHGVHDVKIEEVSDSFVNGLGVQPGQCQTRLQVMTLSILTSAPDSRDRGRPGSRRHFKDWYLRLGRSLPRARCHWILCGQGAHVSWP